MFRAYVDGSYNKDIDTTAYGVVVIDENKNVLAKYNGIINDSMLTAMHQIGGEIIAATVATRLAYLAGEREVEIFYDYKGIYHWAKLHKPWNSNRRGTIGYQDFMHYMQKDKGIKIKFNKVHGSHSNRKEAFGETDIDIDPLNDIVDEVVKAAFDKVSMLKCRENKESISDIKSKLVGMEIFDIDTIDEEIVFDEVENEK